MSFDFVFQRTARRNNTDLARSDARGQHLGRRLLRRRLPLALAGAVTITAFLQSPSVAQKAPEVVVTPSALSLSDQFLQMEDSSALDAPVIWSGRVVDEAGQAKVGQVSLQVRAPRLGELTSKGTLSQPAVSAVAKTMTDRDGYFVLRAPYSKDLEAYTAEAGWLDLMLIVTTGDGFAMAIDSKQFVEGRWVTELTLAPGEKESSGAIAPDAVETENPRTATQRNSWYQPTVIEVKADSLVGATTQRVATNALYPGGQCTLQSGQLVGAAYTPVAEVALATTSWSANVTYRSSASSSFGVGFGGSAGPFTMVGSTTKDYHSAGTASGPVTQAGYTQVRTQMNWYKHKWSCYQGAGQFLDRYTLEAEGWIGGINLYRGGAYPSCGRNWRSPFPAGWTYERVSGSSESFTATAGVTLNFKPGIKGEFNVTGGSQSGKDLRVSYKNNSNSSKYLCGITGPITGNTRMTSLK
jgi:hypothetical protein